MLKTGFGGTWYSTLFGTPYAEIFKGNGPKCYLVPGQLLLRFAPYLLQ